MLDRWLPLQCHAEFGGPGYLAGQAPPTPNPDNLDGRTLVLGQPKPLRVMLLDGRTRRAVAQTFSQADGTWRFDGVAPGHRFAVEFINDGQFTVEVGGQLLPVNSFVQDWVYAVPYDEA